MYPHQWRYQSWQMPFTASSMSEVGSHMRSGVGNVDPAFLPALVVPLPHANVPQLLQYHGYPTGDAKTEVLAPKSTPNYVIPDDYFSLLTKGKVPGYQQGDHGLNEQKPGSPKAISGMVDKKKPDKNMYSSTKASFVEREVNNPEIRTPFDIKRDTKDWYRFYETNSQPKIPSPHCGKGQFQVNYKNPFTADDNVNKSGENLRKVRKNGIDDAILTVPTPKYNVSNSEYQFSPGSVPAKVSLGSRTQELNRSGHANEQFQRQNSEQKGNRRKQANPIRMARKTSTHEALPSDSLKHQSSETDNLPKGVMKSSQSAISKDINSVQPDSETALKGLPTQKNTHVGAVVANMSHSQPLPLNQIHFSASNDEAPLDLSLKPAIQIQKPTTIPTVQFDMSDDAGGVLDLSKKSSAKLISGHGPTTELQANPALVVARGALHSAPTDKHSEKAHSSVMQNWRACSDMSVNIDNVMAKKDREVLNTTHNGLSSSLSQEISKSQNSQPNVHEVQTSNSQNPPLKTDSQKSYSDIFASFVVNTLDQRSKEDTHYEKYVKSYSPRQFSGKLNGLESADGQKRSDGYESKRSIDPKGSLKGPIIKSDSGHEQISSSDTDSRPINIPTLNQPSIVGITYHSDMKGNGVSSQHNSTGSISVIEPRILNGSCVLFGAGKESVVPQRSQQNEKSANTIAPSVPGNKLGRVPFTKQSHEPPSDIERINHHESYGIGSYGPEKNTKVISNESMQTGCGASFLPLIKQHEDMDTQSAYENTHPLKCSMSVPVNNDKDFVINKTELKKENQSSTCTNEIFNQSESISDRGSKVCQINQSSKMVANNETHLSTNKGKLTVAKTKHKNLHTNVDTKRKRRRKKKLYFIVRKQRKAHSVSEAFSPIIQAEIENQENSIKEAGSEIGAFDKNQNNNVQEVKLENGVSECQTQIISTVPNEIEQEKVKVEEGQKLVKVKRKYVRKKTKICHSDVTETGLLGPKKENVDLSNVTSKLDENGLLVKRKPGRPPKVISDQCSLNGKVAKKKKVPTATLR